MSKTETSARLRQLESDLRKANALNESLLKIVQPLANLHNAYSDMPGAESKLEKQLEGLCVTRLEGNRRREVSLPVRVFAEAARLLGDKPCSDEFATQQ